MSTTHSGIARVQLSARTVGLALGAFFIIAGGLVAAVSDPLELEKGSWLAAYLVLVAGVAQVVLADQQHLLHPSADPRRSEWATTALWLGGNAAVVVGSLRSWPYVVDVGGVALVVALAFAWMRTRGSVARLVVWALRVVYAIVLVSVPVGLVLGHVRA